MEYLLGVLVVVAVLGFVLLPLLRGPRQEATPAAPVSPAAQRAAIYRELVELELDQRVGKLTEPDFRELADALLARAAALIAEEDAGTAAAEAEVEREIAAMRRSLRSARAAMTTESRS
jgi:cytochrome c-type biogenesis protein CcmI